MSRFAFVLAVLVAGAGFPSGIAADDRSEACARLGDVIRGAVDQIVAGDHTARLLTALEAHRRLNCPVNELLSALSIPTIREDGTGERSDAIKQSQ